MADNLRVAIAQFGAALGDVGANLARMHGLLDEAAATGAGLVCFPELCLSGYLLDRADFSDALLDAVEAAEAELGGHADALAVSIAYGVPARVPAGLANSVVLRAPGGARLSYAKTHMDSKERRVFEPGSDFVVDPAGIGLACCYDIAFPEALRILAIRGARAFILPMAWEVGRGFLLERVVSARAVENLAYVVCANQTGTVGPFRFRGGSCVVDPLGAPVTVMDDSPGVVAADLDLDLVDRLRDWSDDRAYPLLEHRRPELYDALRESAASGARGSRQGGQ